MLKAILVDLDGTLVDTRMTNYHAYKEALSHYGFDIEYNYFCQFCNGNHYLTFLPQITTSDKRILSDIHERKKVIYCKYLPLTKVNWNLVDVIRNCKGVFKTALVTTASRNNTYELLNHFDIMDLFDEIITGEDVEHKKPDPEGYLKAMRGLRATPSECMVFEDSKVGIEAAQRSGASVYIVKGYN